jgi:mannan endo-1,4-beta-mannosidase
VSVRDSYLRTIYDVIYASARAGGPSAGGLFWQVMTQGMDGWSDGYEVVFSQSPSTASVIAQQSRRIAGLNAAEA